MKNKIKLRKLNRTSSHRKALFRNMVTSLIEHERIRTTLAKAKEMKRIADRAITWAKKGTRQHKTAAIGYVRTVPMVNKLFNDLGPRYADRNGGYTRVLRTGFRAGDRAPMAILEYVGHDNEIRPARPGRGNPNKPAAAQTFANAAAAVRQAAAAGKTSGEKATELR